MEAAGRPCRAERPGKTPGYTETGLIPTGFALGFNGRDATDTRSELGARFNRLLAVYTNAVLALRGRVAWAHDWVSVATVVPEHVLPSSREALAAPPKRGLFFAASHGCCHLRRLKGRPRLRRKGVAPRQPAHGSTCHRARCERCAR
jgi:hypothetical protein